MIVVLTNSWTLGAAETPHIVVSDRVQALFIEARLQAIEEQTARLLTIDILTLIFLMGVFVFWFTNRSDNRKP